MSCDTGRAICPHKRPCMWGCDFTNDTLDTGEPAIRKVKPYPVVPADIDPVPNTWHKIGAWFLLFIFAVLAVIVLLLFFTGLWVWSLLI